MHKKVFYITMNLDELHKLIMGHAEDSLFRVFIDTGKTVNVPNDIKILGIKYDLHLDAFKIKFQSEQLSMEPLSAKINTIGEVKLERVPML